MTAGIDLSGCVALEELSFCQSFAVLMGGAQDAAVAVLMLQ